MNSSAASSTVRAIGPTWASVVVADTGHTGMRPNCPLMAASPVRQPGNAHRAAAVGAERERRDAGGDRGRGAGARSARRLVQIPRIAGDAGERLSPTPLQPNSLVVVLPIRIAPAVFARSTEGASAAATLSAMQREPNAKRSPPTAIRSLAENGTPCSGPSGSPRITASSAAFAAASAFSGIRRKKALSEACVASRLVQRPPRHLDRRDLAARNPAAQLASRSLHRRLADMECLASRTVRPNHSTRGSRRAERDQGAQHHRHEDVARRARAGVRARDRQQAVVLVRAVGADRQDGGRRRAHDVAIVTDQGHDELTRKASSCPASAPTSRKSAMALAVQKGAPKPDISSAEKFKAAMLAAKSLGMSNPVGGGQSGANLVKIFDKLGIAEAMKAKCRLRPRRSGRADRQFPGPQGGRDRHPAIARADGGARHRHRRPAAAGHPDR